MSSNLYKKWKRAANDLGLEIVSPYQVDFSGQNYIEVCLLLKNFGAPRGMQMALNADDLIVAGYGVSVLNEVDVAEPYDRDVIIEVLADWGWSEDEKLKPIWLKGK